jgi:hypothetical protein
MLQILHTVTCICISFAWVYGMQASGYSIFQWQPESAAAEEGSSPVLTKTWVIDVHTHTRMARKMKRKEEKKQVPLHAWDEYFGSSYSTMDGVAFQTATR